ncbi:MAG: outer membrane lipoprotein chaperone LolA [Acidobacteriota bacterium]
MMKKLALVVFLAFVWRGLLPQAAFGQTTELDQLVTALQNKYNKLTSLAADFTQIYHAPGEKMRRESGQLLLKKPGKMRWDYTSPEAKLFLSDGKSLLEYVPAERYATRSSIKDADDLRAPFAFLLGRGNLRRDFKRIEFSQEAPAKAGNKVLRMIPKRAADFKELLLEIEPGSLQLARLTLLESSGGRSDFLFANLRENVATSDAQFSFKAPVGVEVRNN